MDKTKAAPRRLLQSRRFWSSIISVITLIFAASWPELEEHLDVPRSSAFSHDGSYYAAPSEVAERFVNPLSQISAGA